MVGCKPNVLAFDYVRTEIMENCRHRTAVIDLSNLYEGAASTSKKQETIDGRKQGEAAATRLKLRQVLASAKRVTILVPDNIVLVTKSFFTGLFSEFAKSSDDFMNNRIRFDVKCKGIRTEENLRQALDTLVVTSSLFESLPTLTAFERLRLKSKIFG